MAVRLINLHQQPLRVDLRGGEVLVLASGQRSAALREELLYDNCHLPTWERAGWIARVPARMNEVLADAVPVAAVAAAAPAAPVRRKAAVAAPPVPATRAKPAARKAVAAAPKKKR